MEDTRRGNTKWRGFIATTNGAVAVEVHAEVGKALLDSTPVLVFTASCGRPASSFEGELVDSSSHLAIAGSPESLVVHSRRLAEKLGSARRSSPISLLAFSGLTLKVLEGPTSVSSPSRSTANLAVIAGGEQAGFSRVTHPIGAGGYLS